MTNYNLSHTGANIDSALGNIITPDTSPSSSSTKFVTSGGLYTYLQSLITLGSVTTSTSNLSATAATDIFISVSGFNSTTEAAHCSISIGGTIVAEALGTTTGSNATEKVSCSFLIKKGEAYVVDLGVTGVGGFIKSRSLNFTA